MTYLFPFVIVIEKKKKKKVWSNLRISQIYEHIYLKYNLEKVFEEAIVVAFVIVTEKKKEENLWSNLRDLRKLLI